MLEILILKYSFGQFLPICNKHSDCSKNTFCDDEHFCSNCNILNNNNCNTYNNNCCSNTLIQQCIKVNCLNNYNNNDLNSFLFLIIYLFITYLCLGSYYNKYILNKTGIEIIPNLNFWLSLYSLVKDGINFTIRNINYKNYTIIDNVNSLE